MCQQNRGNFNYEPESARFLSVDPAPPKAGDPVTINRYSYCFADPVNATDPTGALADYDGDGKKSPIDYAVRIINDTYARLMSGVNEDSRQGRQAKKRKAALLDVLCVSARVGQSGGIARAMALINSACERRFQENIDWSIAPEFNGRMISVSVLGTTNWSNSWTVSGGASSNSVSVGQYEGSLSFGAGPSRVGAAVFHGDGHLSPEADGSVAWVCGGGWIAFTHDSVPEATATAGGLLFSITPSVPDEDDMFPESAY